MDKDQVQINIAKRVAQELRDGQLVNLGIGLPTKVANYIPEGVHVMLHSENGFIGLGPTPEVPDLTLVNAGGQPVTIVPGGACFDSCTSFGIVRGGSLDVTVLGALQVDQEGNIANYMIPGKLVPGMGGAMDLLTGAKKVIVAMEHTAKDDEAKILKRCTLPLTAKGQVDMIITEMAVIEVTAEGLLLKEVSEGFTPADVLRLTEADVIVCDSLK